MYLYKKGGVDNTTPPFFYKYIKSVGKKQFIVCKNYPMNFKNIPACMLLVVDVFILKIL